jgi:hypothetical protein
MSVTKITKKCQLYHTVLMELRILMYYLLLEVVFAKFLAIIFSIKNLTSKDRIFFLQKCFLDFSLDRGQKKNILFVLSFAKSDAQCYKTFLGWGG